MPWAIPILPTTSSSLSGVGITPLGPLEGSWVLGFFLDGADMQQPAIFGTIPTKVPVKSFEEANSEISSTGGGGGGISANSRDSTGGASTNSSLIQNNNDGILKDSQGQSVKDGSGNPVRIGVPSVEGWQLGKTSEKYETAGKGPGTINNYKNSGDLGGASYGTYQFASYLPSLMPNGKSRPSSKNSPLKDYINASKFKDKFAGLEPATPEFDNVWKSIAAINLKEFEKDQHDFIQERYYNVMIGNLKRQKLDFTSFGPGVQDLIWSTAVQLGPNRTDIFTNSLEGKTKLTDRDIVEVVSNYKINNVNNFFKSSSSDIKDGVKARWVSEKQDLLKLIKV